MKKNTEGKEALGPQATRQELAKNETDYTRLVNEFKSIQSDLREGVAREGKCRHCKKGGMLGSQVSPTFTSSHNLILQCMNKGCGSDNHLLAVGEEWLHEVEEPEGGLQGDAKALYESILNACDMQVTMKKMDAKIKKLRGVLTDLTHNNSNIPNYNYIIGDTQVPSRADSSDSKIDNKENAPTGDKGKATKPSRNPFKPQPPKERKRSLSESPPTTKRRERSRSRDREREPDSPTSPTPEKEVKKSPPLEMEVELAAKEKRGRSPATDRSKTTEQEEKETVRKKLKVDESVERDELQELREQNQNLMEMVKKLTLQVEQLTTQISSNGLGLGRGPVRNDNKPSLETRWDIEEGSSARSSEGEAGKEARQNSGVDGKSAAGGRTAEREEKKKKSNRPKAQKGTTAAPPNEQETNTAKMSYAKAAAKVAKDPELKERQLRNQRERDKALLLFTAPVEETKATPKEWKVLYIKWNLTVKMRKEGPKELHHLALRMLEKVKVRKLVREVSMIGKSTIALYYIADFHDRITEAFTRAKVTMVDHPETLPTDVGVRTAAVNRVAYLLRRHYYITKLRALLLSQLDTEELRQEAITKSRINHHD